MATENLTIEVSANVRDAKAALEGLSKSALEGSKGLDAISKRGKQAKRALDDMAGAQRKVKDESTGAAKGLKSLAEAAGGKLGESAGRLEKLAEAVGSLDGKLGAAVLTSAAATAAVVAFGAALAGAVAIVSSAREKLERLNQIAGSAIPPETIDRIEQWEAATAGVDAATGALHLNLSNRLTPAVVKAADAFSGLVALLGEGLTAADRLDERFGGLLDTMRTMRRVSLALGTFGLSEAAIAAFGELAEKGEEARESLVDLGEAADDFVGPMRDYAFETREAAKALDKAKEAQDKFAREVLQSEMRRKDLLVQASREEQAAREEQAKRRLDGLRRIEQEQIKMAQAEQDRAEEAAERLEERRETEIAAITQITQATLDSLTTLAGLNTEAKLAQGEKTRGLLEEARTRREANKERIRDLEEISDSERAALAAMSAEERMAWTERRGQLLAEAKQARQTQRESLMALKNRRKEERKQARKAFRMEKALNIAAAVGNAGAAYMGLLEAFAPLAIGAPAAAAGVVAPALAAQLASITAQKLPAFPMGGRVGDRLQTADRLDGPDHVTIRARTDETILTPGQTAGLGQSLQVNLMLDRRTIAEVITDLVNGGEVVLRAPAGTVGRTNPYG